MSMQMGFRWYGEGNDKISLSDIKQIPGVTTIVWALHDKMPANCVADIVRKHCGALLERPMYSSMWKARTLVQSMPSLATRCARVSF